MKNTNTDKGINVSILDKEYLISCSENEHTALLSAARLLDKKMREIRASGKVVGSDRIAVMAGLNIAHELLTVNSDKNSKDTSHSNESNNSDTQSRIQTMQEKIDQVLSNQRELEL
ncbi:Z-ring-associated protein ZapA [hydrothermal vent metagenome]|uniref:Cell division protein ZapA n=1 Tax=hydrothermal vent metagenome TaxID=652676 RepID=A0A3B1AHN0_9ZZZZ